MDGDKRIQFLKDWADHIKNERHDSFCDRDGCKITALLVNGGHYPPFLHLRERLPWMHLEPCRRDDVLMIGYMKTGTHVAWQIAHMLLQQHAQLEPLGKGGAMLEAMSQPCLDTIPSPRVINSHLLPQHIPRKFAEYACKTIYVVRNPKDIVVSYYHHLTNKIGYTGTFDAFLDLFLQGDLFYAGWFQFSEQWHDYLTSHPHIPVHTVYYEGIVNEKSKSILRLAEFLGVECSDELLSGIMGASSFKSMREHDGVPKASSSSIFRKGECGDWKNWFTVAQCERFDVEYAKRLAPRLGFDFKYLN